MKPVRALVVVGLAMLLPGRADAQESRTADSLVRPAPVVMRRDLLIIGAGAGLAFLAQKSDLRVRNEVRSAAWQDQGPLGTLASAGNAWGGSAALALGLGLWGGGVYTRHENVAAVGVRGVEAIVVSGLVTKVLKAGFGRSRPRVTPTDAWDVEFGRGWDNDHESFPSGHSTAAFAFAAAVTSETARRAPDRAVLIGAGTFTLAGVTAFARMYDDAHWLSDVTMGAAIGMASGWAVTRWHATRPGNRLDALLLPGRDGRTLVGATISWR